ncbi:hypothetical protein OG21DRAFT_1602514 [Imleria badia]|nr:hypothetical protein OG21DRAFT_1602514 [Imleria badia]
MIIDPDKCASTIDPRATKSPAARRQVNAIPASRRLYIVQKDHYHGDEKDRLGMPVVPVIVDNRSTQAASLSRSGLSRPRLNSPTNWMDSRAGNWYEWLRPAQPVCLPDARNRRLDIAPPKHRKQTMRSSSMYDSERKRKVEIKCLRLQVKLKDDGLEETEIEVKVAALSEELLSSDTHAIAAAKRAELDKMVRAPSTRRDYAKSEAFDREEEEENK